MKSKHMRTQLPRTLSLAVILLLVGLTHYRTAPVSAQGPGRVTVGRDYKHDVSPPVRDIVPARLPPIPEHEQAEPGRVGQHQDQPDPVVQDFLAAMAMPSPLLNFDGIPYPGVACNCAPPDTNGEVGQTQYVQMVNQGFQVFNKSTGASVFGPAGISTLWSGFGGVCENNGAGDPVVLYDQIANRWVISQFAGSSVPTDECIAVSTTSDATGSYYRYAFHLGTDFFDYPKLGVWPDAYYMSMNVFNAAGTSLLGPQPFAFDRAAMIGGSTATFITPGITGGPTEETYLPSDLDGNTMPPAGAPNSFVEWPSGSPLVQKVWHFHVDFATPANSSFTLFSSVPAAGFTQLCPGNSGCIPQKDMFFPPEDKLDGLGDRLMFRLAYRNFGDHEAVVGNYTVSSGGVAGIRWFEMRNVTNGPVTMYQESTYQPDSTWRWMGSAAMDGSGDLAIGFSASSSSIFPEIRYAGRLAGDPLNSLAQGEATLLAGTGSQRLTGNRWGDYSDLTVDPVDDCTFWYTNEYYATTDSANWRTRIGSFKFPQCGASAAVATFVSSGSQDGWVLESSETSGVGGTRNTSATTFNVGDDAQDRQYRSILSFNTSSLPDGAVITKVTLKIKRSSTVGTSPFSTHGNLVVDVRKGFFDGSTALELNDFNAVASLSAVGTIPNTPSSGWYSKIWTSGILTYINTTGRTQFRLRFNKDDNDDSSADYLKFHSGEAITSSNRPQLIVEYYLP